MSDDFLPEGTPRGLPGPLPRGERILWQGGPTTSGLLVRVFHARLVMLWFLAGALSAAFTAASPGHGLWLAAQTLAVGLGALALLWVLAKLMARTTVYTITDRRVVLHAGISLDVTRNLPFAEMEGASMRAFTDGTGDLPLRLRPGVRLAYLQLWPHVRPWRLSRPEPMLRSVPDAEAVAGILARAVEAFEGGAVPVVVARPGPVEEVPGGLVAAE